MPAVALRPAPLSAPSASVCAAAQRDRALAREHRRGPLVVDVVQHVAGRVVGVGPGQLEIGAIGGDGVAVRHHGVVIAPEREVHVRRHVHQVPRAGGQCGQEVGGRQRRGDVRRVLPGVDLEVQRAGMPRRGGERAVQPRRQFGRPWLRAAVRAPVVARVQVGERVGGQPLEVGVGGMGVGGAAGGRFVGAVQRRPRRRGRRRVALRQHLDQQPGPAVGAGRQRPRAHDRRVGGAGVAGRHVVVDAGAERQRLAPGAQRAAGIAARRLAERAHGLAEVEAPHQGHALVEEGLDVGVGAHRCDPGAAQAGKPRRRAGHPRQPRGGHAAEVARRQRQLGGQREAARREGEGPDEHQRPGRPLAGRWGRANGGRFIGAGRRSGRRQVALGPVAGAKAGAEGGGGCNAVTGGRMVAQSPPQRNPMPAARSCAVRVGGGCRQAQPGDARENAHKWSDSAAAAAPASAAANFRDKLSRWGNACPGHRDQTRAGSCNHPRC